MGDVLRFRSSCSTWGWSAYFASSASGSGDSMMLMSTCMVCGSCMAAPSSGSCMAIIIMGSGPPPIIPAPTSMTQVKLLVRGHMIGCMQTGFA